jgi:hypothetical protein
LDIGSIWSVSEAAYAIPAVCKHGSHIFCSVEDSDLYESGWKAYQDLQAGLNRVEEEIYIAPDVITEI